MKLAQTTGSMAAGVAAVLATYLVVSSLIHAPASAQVGGGGIQPLEDCADSITDNSGMGNCILASRDPNSDMLYPLGEYFDINKNSSNDPNDWNWAFQLPILVSDNVQNVTTPTNAMLHVEAEDTIVRFGDSSAGFSEFSNDMPGLELIMGEMDTGNSPYGYGLKFMSSDPNFSAPDPKLLAAVAPRATESYSSDSDGGMALDFATTPNDPNSNSLPTVRMTIDQNGKVGIGTTTPEQALQVNGPVIRLGEPDAEWDIYGTSNAFAVKDVDAGTWGLWINNSNGYVGIGANCAQQTLHVNGPAMRIGEGALWDIYGTVNSFGIKDVDAGAYRLWINNSNGYVGIGKSSANAQLDVEGTTRTKVLEIMGAGADIAETFPVTDTLEPGTVVAIDPESPGKLCLAQGAYNRCVAGVISGAGDLPAAAILGHEPPTEAAPPIALTGRVWAWCDASNGAIQPGDLLTTSGTPGHAMKVTDHARAQGAIIGKAMSHLENGRGLVLVLVSLQ